MPSSKSLLSAIIRLRFFIVLAKFSGIYKILADFGFAMIVKYVIGDFEFIIDSLVYLIVIIGFAGIKK